MAGVNVICNRPKYFYNSLHFSRTLQIAIQLGRDL
jgi:hypothetical protein